MEYEHKRKRGRQPKLCKRTRAQYDRDVLFCSNLFCVDIHIGRLQKN